VAVTTAGCVEPEVAREDRPDALEPSAQAAQGGRRQAELDLEILGRRRSGRPEMVDEPGCVIPMVAGRRRRELSTAQRVDHAHQALGEEERRTSVKLRGGDTRALGEGAPPPPARPRVLPVAALAGTVRLLVTGPEQARQRAARREREQRPVLQEIRDFLEGIERQLRDEPARLGPTK
jgi:hypothetical protein